MNGHMILWRAYFDRPTDDRYPEARLARGRGLNGALETASAKGGTLLSSDFHPRSRRLK